MEVSLKSWDFLFFSLKDSPLQNKKTVKNDREIKITSLMVNISNKTVKKLFWKKQKKVLINYA